MCLKNEELYKQAGLDFAQFQAMVEKSYQIQKKADPHFEQRGLDDRAESCIRMARMACIHIIGTRKEMQCQ